MSVFGTDSILKKSSSFSILEDHIRNLPFCINVNINEPDDVGMGKSIMHGNLIFGNFINLNDGSSSTTLTATVLPVSRSRASLTFP